MFPPPPSSSPPHNNNPTQTDNEVTLQNHNRSIYQYHTLRRESCRRLSLSCECPLRACSPSMSAVLQPTRLSINYRPRRSTRHELSSAKYGTQYESAHYNNTKIEWRSSLRRVRLFPPLLDLPPLPRTTRSQVHNEYSNPPYLSR